MIIDLLTTILIFWHKNLIRRYALLTAIQKFSECSFLIT